MLLDVGSADDDVGTAEDVVGAADDVVCTADEVVGATEAEAEGSVVGATDEAGSEARLDISSTIYRLERGIQGRYRIVRMDVDNNGARES